jgi:hypothetical protein
MSKISRRYAAAVIVATSAIVLTQANAVSAASAGAGAPDGGPAASKLAIDHSQTPLQVRDHTAKLVGKLAGSQHLRLAIGLKPRDEAGQQKLLAALQDPKSPMFHRYLTARQWNARYSPSAANESAVLNWAKSNGLAVSHRYPNRLLVDIDAPASKIESALHVSLNNYTLAGKSFFANSSDPKLPSSISSIVSSVDGLSNVNRMVSASGMTDTTGMARYSAGPTSKLHTAVHANGSQAALKKAMKQSAKKLAQPNAAPGNYDPTDIYSSQAYDEDALHKQSNCCNPFHNPTTQSPAQTSIAIATAGSHFLSTDMAGWNSAYPYIAYSINEYYIDGTPSSPDYEGTMDTEWATSLANSFGCYCDTAHIYLYSGVNAAFTTFDDIYNSILTNNTAKIVSSSWGCAEIYCTPDATMNTDHAIFNSMAAQGFTLLNSSGDRGAYADCSHVSVSFPASDPNWLGIGATNLELAAGPVYQSQTAWGDVGNCSGNGGGSGGGCSAKYAAPSYQSVISSFCGSSAKAVPDVSLNGDWFNSPQNVYFNGAFSGNGGTSISAPMMAGFYAQQNSYGLELGNVCTGSTPCAPIGQGGRQLYLAANTHAAQGKNAFYDITSGCTTNEVGSGYCGIVGYDRASGWGTPNLLQLAWANSYWSMAEASPPAITMSGPTTGAYHNTGTLSWSIVDQGSPASGVSGYTAKWDADPGDQASEATPGTGASFYSGPASAHGATSGSVSLASAGQGCHTLFVRAWDNIGESAVNSYGPVCYDATAPTTTNPKIALVKGSVVGTDGTLPVLVSWTGSDNLSGVASYQLKESVNGGAYTAVTLAHPTDTSVTVNLAKAHTYQFEVAATDAAGNAGAFAVAAAHTYNLYQENNAAVVYSGGWTKVTTSAAVGGTLKYSQAANKTATFTFTGRQVGWVSVKNSSRGKATAKLDGTSANVNDNAATAVKRDLVYIATTSGGSGSHTLVITNLGTAGTPRIDLDAFVVLT